MFSSYICTISGTVVTDTLALDNLPLAVQYFQLMFFSDLYELLHYYFLSINSITYVLLGTILYSSMYIYIVYCNLNIISYVSVTSYLAKK